MKVAGYVVAIILYSLKVWFKSILILLKYRSYSRGLFFIGAPCRLFRPGYE